MQTPYPEPDDDRPPNDPRSLPGPRHRPALKFARRMWDPAPVAKPMIDPDLDQLSWPERCAEVVRHALLSIEHWLSGGGWLREWIRQGAEYQPHWSFIPLQTVPVPEVRRRACE